MIIISVNVNKLIKNIRIISKLCDDHRYKLIFCIKGLAGNKKLLDRVFQEGELPTILGDSRELHFKNNVSLFKNRTKIFINVPVHYDEENGKDILSYADIFYISTIEHVVLLENIAKSRQKIYNVIVVFDSGDSREGIKLYDDSLDKICVFIKNSKYLKLIGASTNIGCLSNAVPSLKMLQSFSKVVKNIQSMYKFDMEYIIGGSSNFLPLLQGQKLPSNINTICVGEAILLGTIPGYKKNLLGLETEIFFINVDICEIKTLRKNHYQCLLLLGKNDIDRNDIVWPEHIKFINYSSDYLVIQTNIKGFQKYNLKKGNIKLVVKYYALPRLLSSVYTSICFTK
ncbi:MAG: alanine racemase [bacterium]|nr:alanine racemase [bacterium]